MSLLSHSFNPLLDITKIALALQGDAVGHTIDYHAHVASTMPIAYELASKADTRSGTLVVAEEQSAGSGRMQRTWEAPWAQALLLSLILKGNHLPTNSAYLPMLAGIAVVRAIVSVLPELADEIGLKWPNDVLLGADLASGRKVAGILIETAYLQNQMEHAIIGIGINVNQSEDHLPRLAPDMPAATSLRIEVGRSIDRSDLLIALGKAWSDLLEPQETEFTILQQWRALLYTLGQPVTVRHFGQNGAILTGTAVDVTVDGALVILDESGQTHTVGAADVTMRKL